jgi:hypothetical protein
VSHIFEVPIWLQGVRHFERNPRPGTRSTPVFEATRNHIKPGRAAKSDTISSSMASRLEVEGISFQLEPT